MTGDASVISSCLQLHQQQSKRTHAHSVFIWVFSARLSHIHDQSELTKREKENAIQRLGKASIIIMGRLKCLLG